MIAKNSHNNGRVAIGFTSLLTPNAYATLHNIVMSEIITPSYCAYCERADAHPLHVEYHNTEYGFPNQDESILFERLVLEINQAGLSWETILKKREGFKQAFEGFEVDRVASYGERDRERLLQDASIIRNRLKIDAAIHNAKQIQALRDSDDGFHNWLMSHHPKTKDVWVKIFKSQFRFVGGEIVNEFLMSLGILPGAHVEACKIYKKNCEAQSAFSAEALGFFDS